MYKERFIATIKHNGRILRERNGVVTLPFGSEYSLLLKNLESVKAVVDVSIDGKDTLDRKSVIVRPNSSTELKGFMKGTTVTNKFKFINKTKEIADYRGDRLDDGLVRVEFKFEKKKVTKIVEEKRIPWRYTYPRVCPCCGFNPCICPHYWRWEDSHFDWSYHDNSSSDFTVFYSNSSDSFAPGSNFVKCNLSHTADSMLDNSAPLEDEGITVKGSKTRQDFSHGWTDTLEESSSVIVIKLRGTKSNGTVVRKPVTVRTRLTCPTCGKKSKSSAKFCRNCGTCLE